MAKKRVHELAKQYDMPSSEVVKRLEKYQALGKRFEPTEQIRKLAAEGKGFYAE